jgi:malonyl CoA-acyl carrier protein transacylase
MIDFATHLQAGTQADSVVADLSWESELFVLQGEDRHQLQQHIDALLVYLEGNPEVCLKDLAATLAAELQPTHVRLVIVAGSSVDLHSRLTRARDRLADPRTHLIRDSLGIYFYSEPLYRQGGVALLFPGEGAQYTNMLGDLLPHFPEVEDTFAEADRCEYPITPTFLIPAAATETEKAEAEKRLRTLAYSICSVLLADLALYRILDGLQVPLSAVAGHSAGELTALHVSGSLVSDHVLNIDQIITTMTDLEQGDDGTPASGDVLLLAVGAGRNTVTAVLGELGLSPDVYVAMDNCPHQSVVVGPTTPMEQVEAGLQARGVICERLPFHRPYHTPLFEPFMGPLRGMFPHSRFESPRIPIYCCTTGKRFPDDPQAMRDLTLAHWTSPVEFSRMIQSMHADGIRLFVETGPRGNLTAFTEDILRGQPVAALAANVMRRSGITQLNHLIAQLVAHQVPLRLSFLYERRQPRHVEWTGADAARQDLPNPSTASGAVVTQYLAVMDEFLQMQQSVMEQYLARGQWRNQAKNDQHDETTPLGDLTLTSSPDPALSLDENAPWIMLGTIIQLEPGYEVVTRRHLTLEEDLYLHHHALGGADVSRIDPDQHGAPVLPMTFSLETMAEAARLLQPGLKIIAIENVRLQRWIAAEEGKPTILEIRARLLPVGDNDAYTTVSVTIADCGHDPENPKPRITVESQVLLGSEFPMSGPSQINFANERQCSISREQLYHNMFHGKLFRGIQSTDRLGDLAIEGTAEVPHRQDWFTSTTEPALVLDPVLLDIAMHILAGWHLEQPDQAGRILLPFKLDRIEFFAPLPEPGTRLIVRGGTDQETARYVKHRIEVSDTSGQLIYGMEGAWYWRFYLPFQGKINFNSRKDEYFLSNRWNDALPPQAKACCMILEPAVDLQQTLLQASMARVTCAPEELREYFELNANPMQRVDWLFLRLAGKDATRQLWYDLQGERLMPADMILAMDENNRPIMRFRDPGRQERFPAVRMAKGGGKMAAIASLEGRPGIALNQVAKTEPVAHLDQLDEEEVRWLKRYGGDETEAFARFVTARQAIVSALCPEVTGQELDVVIRGADPTTGLFLGTIGPVLSEVFPEFAHQLLQVQTAQQNDLVIATTLCQRAE